MIAQETILVFDEQAGDYLPTEVVLVQCFGLKNIPGKITDKYLYKYPDVSDQPVETSIVKEIEVFNDQKRVMEKFLVVDYLAPCPACGKLMHVQALAGTVWMACCSKECYGKYWDSLKGNMTIISAI